MFSNSIPDIRHLRSSEMHDVVQQLPGGRIVHPLRVIEGKLGEGSGRRKPQARVTRRRMGRVFVGVTLAGAASGAPTGKRDDEGKSNGYSDSKSNGNCDGNLEFQMNSSHK